MDENNVELAQKRKKHKKKGKSGTRQVVVKHICKIDALNIHNMENILNKVYVPK